MEEWYDTKPCDGWDDFLQKVRALPTSVFYRGQSNDTQPLKSSFDRAVDASESLAAFRRRLCSR